MLNQFKQYIDRHHLFQKKDVLLLAVSGGVDSVALCELCFQAGYTFYIAHVNYQLRGKESEEDEVFVEMLAKKYNTISFIKRFQVAQSIEVENGNIQQIARQVRYDWFNEIIAGNPDLGIQFVATAHHVNDNIETVLMNIFKGTGIKGLVGMQPTQGGIGGRVVRPMLFAKKQEIIQFSTEHKLLWREDSSNSTVKYTRNFVRSQVIPTIAKVFPQVEENVIHSIERFAEFNIIYRKSIHHSMSKLIYKKGSELHIPARQLLKAEALNTIVFELFQPFGFTVQQIPEIIKFCSADSGSYINSPTHRLIKNRDWLIISSKESSNNSIYLIEAGQNNIVFSGKEMSISLHNELMPIISDKWVALLDLKKISFPLILRKWKQGDYFYPLGMSKKKKISRFLIDQKLSILEKEDTWVIESDKKIIWLVGMRIDDRFKISPHTKEVIRLTISK